MGSVKGVTPTDRLSGFGTGLATDSDFGERVPRGHGSPYSNPNGSVFASFFRSLATQNSRIVVDLHIWVDLINKSGWGYSDRSNWPR